MGFGEEHGARDAGVAYDSTIPRHSGTTSTPLQLDVTTMPACGRAPYQEMRDV